MKVKSENAEQVYNRILKENKGDLSTCHQYIDERLETAKQVPNHWGRYMMFNFWNRVKSFAK